MKLDLLFALLAFFGGVLISAGLFALSRYVLKAKPEFFSYLPLLRQPVQIAYPVILWLIDTPYDRLWLIFGAVLGITVPSVLFTALLVKYNDSLHRKEEDKDG